MNQNAQRVLYRFRSEENKEGLYRALAAVANNERSMNLLRTNFGQFINHFCKRMDHELANSDPIMSADDQVTCFNAIFLKEYRAAITNEVRCDNAVGYAVRDGEATTRNSRWAATSPNDLLESWKNNVGRGKQLREDPQYIRRRESTVDIANGSCTGRRPNEHNEHFQGGHSAGFAQTGIVFCDQSGIGTSRHIDALLGNNYIQALNRDQGHADFAFGYANSVTDARLMSRRIFRDGGDGENTIPNYERRLYRRNLDRNIDEDLSAPQYDYMQHGFDMKHVRDRLTTIRERKEELRRQYDEPVPTYYNRDEW
jgi:hypothetical protein